MLGLILAWSLAATPGPANALIAQEAARRGWRAGWFTGLGAIVGDVVMFFLMWGGVLVLVARHPWLEPVLAALGAVLLAWLAWGAWRLARRGPTLEAEGRGSFGRSFLIVVTSPLNWAWWVGAGSSMFEDFGLAIVAGFFAGLLSWVAFWSGLARAGAVRIKRFAEGVAYASAVVLAAFALYLAWTAARDGVALLETSSLIG